MQPDILPRNTFSTTSAPIGGGRQILDVNVADLISLAVRGLRDMFDAEKRLFCFRLKQSNGQLVREGYSSRYTIMSILGLRRLEKAGIRLPIITESVVGHLLEDVAAVDNIGDLGLTLWLCALASPERLEEVYTRFKVESAITRYQAAREGNTMDLAWFLSGLAHAASVASHRLRGLNELALGTYGLLKENQGVGGLFGHVRKNSTLAGVTRAHIGSFADQVYPIYAIAKFAQAFQAPGALAKAQKCADRICRAQGSLGQWWWHYHSRTGEVFEHYPVYAVHQHGMAPMALFALAEATQVDFSEPIYRGLQWIAGENELTVDLRAPAANVVWRCIYDSKKLRKHALNVASYLGFPTGLPVGHHTINFECRPYELGWLLYAFADQYQEAPATRV